MNIRLRKKIVCLIGLILIIPFSILAENNQGIHFYEVPLTTQTDRRIRFFNDQDLSNFINHIEFLAENANEIGRHDILEESLKIKEFLEMLKGRFIDSGKYKGVELHLCSVTTNVNGKKYLMPFVAELYGVITNDYLEIHKL